LDRLPYVLRRPIWLRSREVTHLFDWIARMIRKYSVLVPDCRRSTLGGLQWQGRLMSWRT
jgi:hypothetical protein